jgi:hypothetical protein
MLYGYPISAIKNNWLHSCIKRIIKRIHLRIDQGRDLPPWEDLIPSIYKEKLQKRYGLKSRFFAYSSELISLSKSDRDRILQTLYDENDIINLLSCRKDCEKIEDLPSSIQSSIKNLFDFAFGLLGDLGVRNEQYKIIYEDSEIKMCPFCGFEYFDGLLAPKHDLDHYLKISSYPFAAVNLTNLVPMGDRCNTAYKHDQDILYSAAGSRRPSFFPYSHNAINVILKIQDPFGDNWSDCPNWVINFEPHSLEIDTWDTVFKIRQRYVQDRLNPHFKNWLSSFANFCKTTSRLPTDTSSLSESLRNYRDICNFEGFKDGMFLKTSFFSMFLHYCDTGEKDAIRVILGAVHSV